jgi:lipid-A-disaccharide synthase
MGNKYMNYFLIAGEASGDLHASNLMAAIKEQDTDAEFRFFGGDLMQQAGGTLVKHYRELAYMGVIPVLLHLRTILRNMKLCKEEIKTFQPDVVILVDYPGFNLKIAKYVKRVLSIPVYYYISPKIWAWKKYRIHSFRRYVDRMFCIFPFEKEFYTQLNYLVDYVGNPAVDAVASFRERYHDSFELFTGQNQLSEKPIIALLGGSRKQEIRNNLPLMIDVALSFPEYQPVIAGAPGLEPDDYTPYLNGRKIPILFGQTYSLLTQSHTALVTSGTATLETSLFRTPQVVCYYFWGKKLVNFVFRHFFHVPYISLVNLLAGREVVQELFGAKFTYTTVQTELNKLLNNSSYRDRMLAGYDEIIETLGQPGASQRAAIWIVQSLRNECS